jgi:hypothetical protein
MPKINNQFELKNNDIKRSKKVIFLLLALFIFGVLPIIVIEIAGRVVIHSQYGVEGKSYGLWRYDSETGAQHNENAYNKFTTTNDFGFRNVEDVLEPKEKESFRILTYGGSTTFCYNLSDEEAWPARLEQQLRKFRHPKDQVLNAGAINWSLGHAFARAKKDIPVLKPDYVLIYSGINEGANANSLRNENIEMKALVADGKYGVITKNFDQNRWLKRNSIIVRVYDYYVKAFITELFSNQDEEGTSPESIFIDPNPDEYVLKNYLVVLEDFIEFIEQNGAKAVFIIQSNGDNSNLNRKLTSYSIAGAAAASKLGVKVVDSRDLLNDSELSDDLFYHHTEVHYSATGALKLADLIAREAFGLVD